MIAWVDEILGNKLTELLNHESLNLAYILENGYKKRAREKKKHNKVNLVLSPFAFHHCLFVKNKNIIESTTAYLAFVHRQPETRSLHWTGC